MLSKKNVRSCWTNSASQTAMIPFSRTCFFHQRFVFFIKWFSDHETNQTRNHHQMEKELDPQETFCHYELDLHALYREAENNLLVSAGVQNIHLMIRDIVSCVSDKLSLSLVKLGRPIIKGRWRWKPEEINNIFWSWGRRIWRKAWRVRFTLAPVILNLNKRWLKKK